MGQNLLGIGALPGVHAMRCMDKRNVQCLGPSIPGHSVSKFAAAAFFDLAAVFPSVAREWLARVMKAIKVPEGIQTLAASLYSDVKAFVTFG